MKQVLLLAHGWGYNHHFFDAFLKILPAAVADQTLIACLEEGYFPEQARPGLMILQQGEWTWQASERLSNLVLAHAELPWLGLGHSLGFAKLLNLSIRWHSLFSLHGFTRFTASAPHPEGTPARIMTRMLQKAQHNLAAVLQEFHARCGHTPHWTRLNAPALLDDLALLQSLDTSLPLAEALSRGAGFQAWCSESDPIVPFDLTKACFEKHLSALGHALHLVDGEHAAIADCPSLYTPLMAHLLPPI